MINYEVVIANDPLRFTHSTVYVEANGIIEAIQAAEKHVAQTTAQDPERLITVSAKEADAQRIIKANRD